VESLLKANGVTYLHGTGTLIDPRRVQVRMDDGQTQDVQARSVVIASGSTEWRPNLPGMDLPGVIDSKQALELTEVPRSVVVAGGGPIGVEFATVFAAFGAEVTVVEMLPNLLPLEDPDLGRELARQFGRRKIGVRTGFKLEGIRQVDGGLEATISGESGTETLRAEKVLVAVSRAPVTDGLGLERLGVELNKRFIRVDKRMQTNVPAVYAIGDVAGGGLAHVASMQGEVAVENALGHASEMDYRAVPSVTFSTPQVASVGLSEEKARATGQTIRVGRFPFAANSKAVIIGESSGFVKVVAEAKYGQVLGVHMIGPEVTDLISEGVLAIMMEATIDDIAATIHAHPTLPESFKEATLDVSGRAIHIYRRRS
jgi:dihydrolipoamide dehydrogenase